MITLFGSLDKHHEYQHSPITVRALDDVIEGNLPHSDLGSRLTSSLCTHSGVIRSLNNLLERFHQSFFFYL